MRKGSKPNGRRREPAPFTRARSLKAMRPNKVISYTPKRCENTSMTDKWTDAELIERARKLQHRFLNEAEGEYVATVIGRLIHAFEDLKELK